MGWETRGKADMGTEIGGCKLSATFGPPTSFQAPFFKFGNEVGRPSVPPDPYSILYTGDL